MLGQPKHTGSWDGARTRDGVMGNEYSQLSQEPLGRWTKPLIVGMWHSQGADAVSKCRHRRLREKQMTVLSEASKTPNGGRRSQEENTGREPAESCVRLGCCEAASDNRWTPEFWAGILRQKFMGVKSKSDMCILNYMPGKFYHLHFSDEQTGVSRWQVICSKSQAGILVSSSCPEQDSTDGVISTTEIYFLSILGTHSPRSRC